MARKASRHKKSSAVKARKSSATRPASGAKRTAGSAPAGRRKTVSVEKFVRSVRTLHDRGLVSTFLKSAKRAGLTLTMDAAALERVKSSVKGQRQTAPASGGTRNAPIVAARTLRAAAPAGVAPTPGKDPFDFGSDAAASGGLVHVAPLPGEDPFDF